jgi:hypothetical protein
VLARSTRWIAPVLAAGAAVAWFALRDDARDGRDASAADQPDPGREARADADLHAAAPSADEPQVERRTEIVRTGGAGGGGSAVPAPHELALALVDPRGAPVGDARWVAFDGDAVLANGTTADDGAMLVRLSAGDAVMLELAVERAGFHPLRATLPSEPARQTIVIGGGAAISGVVRIDGAAPAEPFSLRLAADEPFWEADELPAPVAEALFRRPRAVALLGATTGAGGAFRFEGLAAGWAGRISWWKYPLANPPPSADPFAATRTRRVDVTAPRAGLVLDLLSPFELVGRVVELASGDPVPRPFVEAAWSHGDTSTGTQGTYAEDGTFAIAFWDEMPTRVEVNVGDHAGSGRRKHLIEIPRGVRRWDAGALAIAWTRNLAFCVLDADGMPVAGATVAGVPGGDESWRSATSAADGSGTIAVPADATGLRAVALGFEPGLAALPPPGAENGAEPIEIVLLRATTLELVLPPNARELGAMLVFGAEEPFLKAGAPSWSPETWPQHVQGIRNEGEGGFALYRGAEDGRYVFGGLRPGLALQVAASDAFGNRVAERSVAPLAAGERRVVGLVVGRELGVLWGQVVDSAGAPVPRASVMLGRVGDESYHGGSADDAGRFRVENLAADRVMVVVAGDGHPVRKFPALRVDGSPVELVLEPGREVRITVVDEKGEAVPDLRIVPSRDGDTWWKSNPTEEAPGEYVVGDAPAGAIDFTIQVGGRNLPGRIETGAEATRVVVGLLQACTIALAEPFAPAPGRIGYAHLVRIGEKVGGELSARLAVGATELRFDRVFPGRYEAYVEDQGPGPRRRFCDPVELEVTADAPARVVLVLHEP